MTKKQYTIIGITILIFIILIAFILIKGNKIGQKVYNTYNKHMKQMEKK